MLNIRINISNEIYINELLTSTTIYNYIKRIEELFDIDVETVNIYINIIFKDYSIEVKIK